MSSKIELPFWVAPLIVLGVLYLGMTVYYLGQIVKLMGSGL